MPVRNLRRALVALLSCGIAASPALGGDKASSDVARSLSAAQGIVASLVIPRQDGALAAVVERHVDPRQFHGAIGEALASDRGVLVLLDIPESKGNAWRAIYSREAPQGIDQILMEFDQNGRATGKVETVECKVTKSVPVLEKRKSGVQATSAWNAPHIQETIRLYEPISRLAVDQLAMSELRPKGAVDFTLPSGDKGWIAPPSRDHPSGSTNFATANQRQQALAQSKETVGALQRALDGNSIKSKVLWAKPITNGYAVQCYKVPTRMNPSNSILVSTLPRLGGAIIKSDETRVLRAGFEGLLKEIKRAFPWTNPKEQTVLARVLLRNDPNLHHLLDDRAVQFRSRTLTAGLKGGAFGGGLALLGSSMLGLLGEMDWRQVPEAVLVGFGAGSVGTASGVVAVQSVIKNPTAFKLVTSLGAKVGLQPLASVRLAGGGAGGVAATLALTTYLWASGGLTSNVALTVGVDMAVFAGVTWAVESAVVYTIAAFGTASSGVAIGGLSGVAATSAVTAWVGGGSIAAGGMGAAVGSAVLTGGVALVAIGVVWVGKSAWDTWQLSSDITADRAFVSTLMGFRLADALHDQPSWYRAMAH